MVNIQDAMDAEIMTSPGPKKKHIKEQNKSVQVQAEEKQQLCCCHEISGSLVHKTSATLARSSALVTLGVLFYVFKVFYECSTGSCSKKCFLMRTDRYIDQT